MSGRHRPLWTLTLDALGAPGGDRSTLLGRLAVGVDQLRANGAGGDAVVDVCKCAAVRLAGLGGSSPALWSDGHCDVGVAGPVLAGRRRYRVRR